MALLPAQLPSFGMVLKMVFCCEQSQAQLQGPGLLLTGPARRVTQCLATHRAVNSCNKAQKVEGKSSSEKYFMAAHSARAAWSPLPGVTFFTFRHELRRRDSRGVSRKFFYHYPGSVLRCCTQPVALPLNVLLAISPKARTMSSARGYSILGDPDPAQTTCLQRCCSVQLFGSFGRPCTCYAPCTKRRWKPPDWPHPLHPVGDITCDSYK